MPGEGYKSVTIPEEVYAELQTRAEKNCRSVAKEIEHLLKTRKQKEV